MRPSSTPWASARGIEAAEVLACSATVEITRERVDADALGHAVEDALIGLVGNEPVDVGDLDPRDLGGASKTASLMLTTAWRKTWLPCMRRCPTVPVADGPPST